MTFVAGFATGCAFTVVMAVLWLAAGDAVQYRLLPRWRNRRRK